MNIRLLLPVVITTIIFFVLYNFYFWAFPRVTLINNTSATIKQAEVKLPSSKLTFSGLQEGEAFTIYRHAGQKDGVYQYRIVFSKDEEIHGKCGYVTTNEYFTDFRISVISQTEVICERKTK